MNWGMVEPDLSASLRALSGVAPEMASGRGMKPGVGFQLVIWAGKDTSRNTRPVMAGLNTFWPMPPKGSLATQMATNAPTNTIHGEIADGRFMARSRPVTTADRSPTVEGRFIIHLVTAPSSSTQESTLTARTSSSDQPYARTETTIAGHSAMITSRMMEVVETFAWMCGFGETIYFLSIRITFWLLQRLWQLRRQPSQPQRGRG